MCYPSKGSAYLGLQNGTVTAKTKQLKSVFGTKTELITRLIMRNLKIVNDHENRLSVNDHENVLALMIKKNVLALMIMEDVLALMKLIKSSTI